MYKYSVRVLCQGTLVSESVWPIQAGSALEAIDLVEEALNPANSNGRRKHLYCYEARRVTPDLVAEMLPF